MRSFKEAIVPNIVEAVPKIVNFLRTELGSDIAISVRFTPKGTELSIESFDAAETTVPAAVNSAPLNESWPARTPRSQQFPPAPVRPFSNDEMKRELARVMSLAQQSAGPLQKIQVEFPPGMSLVNVRCIVHELNANGFWIRYDKVRGRGNALLPCYTRDGAIRIHVHRLSYSGIHNPLASSMNVPVNRGPEAINDSGPIPAAEMGLLQNIAETARDIDPQEGVSLTAEAPSSVLADNGHGQPAVEAKAIAPSTGVVAEPAPDSCTATNDHHAAAEIAAAPAEPNILSERAPVAPTETKKANGAAAGSGWQQTWSPEQGVDGLAVKSPGFRVSNEDWLGDSRDDGRFGGKGRAKNKGGKHPTERRGR